MFCVDNNKKERVWIGVGSNLLNPKKQVDRAVQALSRLPITQLVAISSYYRSRPLGQFCQSDFLNMIVVLDTHLSPELLLSFLQYIELQQGRVRNNIIWQPRTLDLDILLFGKNVICNPKLIIPHYDILNREFVIYPLIELEYNLVFPNGKTVLDCVKKISKNGLTFWEN